MAKNIDQLEKSFANKSANYWASMRTNIKLMERAAKAKEDHYKKLSTDKILQLEQELGNILDSGILTHPNTLSQIGIGPNMPLADRKVAFGLRSTPLQHTEDEQRFLDNMAQKANSVRKCNWSWRIGEEAEQKHKLGWHPFFVTLTVDPQKADPKQLWQERKAFRQYIRALADTVTRELGHPLCRHKPYRPESDYVTYAGVIEHGKSREHHHAHFIIWLRAIPKDWRQCPNRGIANPANRTKNECLPMRTLWPWSLPGLSPALYFRSIGDIWEKAYNFMLPLKDGQPMRVSNPRVAGHYITKYLSKEHKEWHHRMKATRNLGLNRLNQFLETQDQKTITALTWRADNSTTNFSLLKTHTVPQGLLRSAAKQRLYLLQFREKQLDLRQLLTSNSEIFTAMLSSVRSGIRPDRMDSHQFFDWVTQLLPVQKEYCRNEQLIAHRKLAHLFPQDPQRIQHTKIGANAIGYS